MVRSFPTGAGLPIENGPAPTRRAGMRLSLAAMVFASHCVTAQAACWFDEQVAAFAGQIAAAGFPAAAGTPPEILVCDAQHFAPGIGGDYQSGAHRIRVPVWQLGRPDLRNVIAHELAHAEVAVRDLDGGPDGHNRNFYIALLKAGYHDEARRVAQYVGNVGELAFAESRVMGAAPPREPSSPPPPAGRQCEVVIYIQRFILPGNGVQDVYTRSLRCYPERGQ